VRPRPFGPLPFRCRQLLVCHGDCNVVGNVLRRRHIIRVVRARLFREETETHYPVARYATDVEDRPIPGGNQVIVDVRVAAHESGSRSSEVAHNVERLVTLQCAPAAARQILSRSGLERHVPVSIAKHQLERVMAQHRLNDLGDARKHGANVQHLRDSAQQCGGGVGPHDTNARRRAMRPREFAFGESPPASIRRRSCIHD
jgi:hypothetical protein